MKQITAEGGKRVNAYSVCIPTGNNDIEDTINGFLLNLDKSIDVFAAKVRNDTNLKYGTFKLLLTLGCSHLLPLQVGCQLCPPVILF